MRGSDDDVDPYDSDNIYDSDNDSDIWLGYMARIYDLGATALSWARARAARATLQRGCGRQDRFGRGLGHDSDMTRT